MSIVGVVEALAWVLSAVIAIWMAQDVIRVARTHDEASLINAPDPLEEPHDPPAATGAEGSRA